MSQHFLLTGAVWLTASDGKESFAACRRHGGIGPKQPYKPVGSSRSVHVLGDDLELALTPLPWIVLAFA
jgi:hypothetical protein